MWQVGQNVVFVRQFSPFKNLSLPPGTKARIVYINEHAGEIAVKLELARPELEKWQQTISLGSCQRLGYLDEVTSEPFSPRLQSLGNFFMRPALVAAAWATIAVMTASIIAIEETSPTLAWVKSSCGNDTTFMRVPTAEQIGRHHV